jgi:hypothetical protein
MRQMTQTTFSNAHAVKQQMKAIPRAMTHLDTRSKYYGARS